MRRITVKGNNYECGLQIGIKLRKEIRENVERRHFSISEKDLQKIHAACLRKYPRYVEELRGIAEGAAVDYYALLLLNSPAHREHGCSGIAINDGKQTLLAHNEDESKAFYRKDMLVLVTMIMEDITITAFYYPGEIVGTAFGWNSHGMYFTANRLFPKPRPAEKLPLYFAARAIYDARSVDEAIRIARGTSHGSGWHYFAAKGRRIVSIEQLYGKSSVTEISGRYEHTNHFLHKSFAHVPSPDPSTVPRLRRMHELAGEEPLAVLFDDANPPCAIYNDSDDLDITLGTALLDVRRKTVTVYETKRKKQVFKGY